MGLLTALKRALGFGPKPTASVIVVGLDNSGKSTLVNQLKPKKAATFEATPTVGFSVEGFTKDSVSFTAFDMSGQAHYRTLWEQYYREAQAVIFVVDSTDKVRMCVVKDELETMLSHADIAGRRVPILFFANKVRLLCGVSFSRFPDRGSLGLGGGGLGGARIARSASPLTLCRTQMDVPTALSPVECMGMLDLAKITDKPWHIRCDFARALSLARALTRILLYRSASNAVTGDGVEEGVQWLAEQLRKGSSGK